MQIGTVSQMNAILANATGIDEDFGYKFHLYGVRGYTLSLRGGIVYATCGDKAVWLAQGMSSELVAAVVSSFTAFSSKSISLSVFATRLSLWASPVAA